MSLSPSSNAICKIWEQSNTSDSPTVTSDKERLLTYIYSKPLHNNILIPDSDSLMIINTTHRSLLITTLWEINTGQQKSLPKIYHVQDPLFNSVKHSIKWGRSTVLFTTCISVTPQPMSQWIVLPLHNYVSYETTNNSMWLYMGFFDSQTQVFKMYILSLSPFSNSDFSFHPYDNGFVLAHNVGFFINIVIGQENKFVWTPIPAHQSLDICQDGSTIILSHHNSTTQLYDMQTGAAVSNPLQGHTGISIIDDRSQIMLHDWDSRVIRVFDMTLDGKVITVINDAEDYVPFSFVGGSKIAYVLHECLIIQSLVTGSILFRHGIPSAGMSVTVRLQATPDGARVVIYRHDECMIWDVEDL